MNYEVWKSEEDEETRKHPRPEVDIEDICAEFHILTPGDPYVLANGVRIGMETCKLNPPGPGSIPTEANEPSSPSFTCKKILPHDSYRYPDWDEDCTVVGNGLWEDLIQI